MPTFSVKTIQPKRNFSELKPSPPKKSGFFGSLTLVVVMAAVLYVLFTYVLPSVKITIILMAEDFKKEYELILDQNIPLADETQLIFPAKIYTLEGDKEDTFAATGEKDMGEKASGQANFYNYTGRSQPLTTKIELIHSSGKKYFLKNDLTIPAASVSEVGEIVPGTAQAEVKAAEAGEGYNQPQDGRLNISVLSLDLQNKIYAEASAIGGGTSKIVRVVSQDDLDNAQDELLSVLGPKLKDELRQRFKKSHQVMFDELTALEVIENQKSTELDKEADEFKVKTKARLKALVFDGLELKKYLKAKSLIDIPDDKMVATDDLGELEVSVEEIDWENGIAKVQVKVKYKILPHVDLNQLKQAIKGLSEREARRFLMGQDNIRDVRFDFSLSLSSRVPENLNKIDIKVGN